MNWIEIIKVRSFSSEEKRKALELFSNFSNDGSYKITLYQDHEITTDFIVCLNWSGLKGKHISEKLVAALKNYGWISHSIWEPLAEPMINKEIC